MASLGSLEKAWERYKEISYAEGSRAGTIDIEGSVLEQLGKEIKNIDDIRAKVEEAEKDKVHATSHILEIVFAGAIAIDASDIHFEPKSILSA
jgi:type II secretory ATPase GspE/PulE/Tfp pilus assembly ATPase PilB-like protein